MPKKIYKRFLILLRIILPMIKTSFRNKKVWTNSYKPSPKSSFSILLSFDCHSTKIEPRNAVNSAFLGSCTLFKLVSQEFYSDNFNSAFAIFCRYIRHIRRHIFYCHKNCTQNVLMHQANNLFLYTKVISRYCIRS